VCLHPGQANVMFMVQYAQNPIIRICVVIRSAIEISFGLALFFDAKTTHRGTFAQRKTT
jgi:hypothetical protein